MDGGGRSGDGTCHSAAMSRRPLLKAHCRPLLREDGTVQLGVDPGPVVRVAGLTRAERDLLLSLDGGRDLDQVLADAARAGVREDRARALVDLLDTEGLTVLAPAGRYELHSVPRPVRDLLVADAVAASALDPASSDGYGVLARRARRAVLLVGAGPVTTSLAALLTRAGVGDVARERHPGLPFDWPGAGSRPEPAVARPDLVVLLSGGPTAPGDALAWQRRGIPHLPVVLGATAASVGPLVLPGRTPCLGCVDLTRGELDPSWPSVRAQLLRHRIRQAGPATAETTLTALAAALAAAVALGHLDDRRQPPGVSLHAEVAWPTLHERHWTPHPRCGCLDSPTPVSPPEGTMAG